MNKIVLLTALVVMTFNTGYSFNILEKLIEHNIQLKVRLNQYDVERDNAIVWTESFTLDTKKQKVKFKNSIWHIQPVYTTGADNQIEIQVVFECTEGEVENASLSIDLVSQNWSTANYVLMPGAVYNGNRYPFVKSVYPPFVQEFRQLGPGKPMLISDQPKLNYKEGASRIQERSGSMSIPAIGYHSPGEQKNFFMWFAQSTDLGDYGVDIEESADRSHAIISLTAPVVRERVKYNGCNMDGIADDKPANFKKGNSVTIDFKLLLSESKNIQSLFNQFAEVQKSFLQSASITPVLPLSNAYEVVKNKYNRANWMKKGDKGYYATQTTSDLFQMGWIGGVITLLPLLQEGDEVTKMRVYENLEWLFERSETGSNYLPDRIKDGKQATILDYKPIGKLFPLVLARRNAEAAYYLFLLFEELEKQGKPVPVEWTERTLAAIDAQYSTWEKYGDLGQFVNSETGEVVVGNSTSAGLFPASLCKAFELTGDSAYIMKATNVAEYFYTDFATKGISCGGPGDALQSIDSESSYGLLLGFAELYKATGYKIWLDRSIEMAYQFASWVVAYNFEFPAESLHGRLKMQTAGTVIANTQNKHTAPGICTYSGSALLDLYRFTGDYYFLELLSFISKTIPQYLATRDRPIACLEEGWVSERINMTDWSEGIGETNCQSNWSEVALLLTYAELPGIYVDLGKEKVSTLDHIEAKVIRSTENGIVLELYNPTKYNARVKLVAERPAYSSETYSKGDPFTKVIAVEKGSRVEYEIAK